MVWFVVWKSLSLNQGELWTLNVQYLLSRWKFWSHGQLPFFRFSDLLSFHHTICNWCVILKFTQDARFYGLSTKFEPFSNKGKPLVIQFTVKHEQNIDCGGGYLKVFDCSLDQKDMHGDSPYLIMFGKLLKSFMVSHVTGWSSVAARVIVCFAPTETCMGYIMKFYPDSEVSLCQPWMRLQFFVKVKRSEYDVITWGRFVFMQGCIKLFP